MNLEKTLKYMRIIMAVAFMAAALVLPHILGAHPYMIPFYYGLMLWSLGLLTILREEVVSQITNNNSNACGRSSKKIKKTLKVHRSK